MLTIADGRCILFTVYNNVTVVVKRKMDRDLLRQCLTYHGESLFNKLKCEQTENPDFQAVVSDLCKATCERYQQLTFVCLVLFYLFSEEDISS